MGLWDADKAERLSAEAKRKINEFDRSSTTFYREEAAFSGDEQYALVHGHFRGTINENWKKVSKRDVHKIAQFNGERVGFACELGHLLTVYSHLELVPLDVFCQCGLRFLPTVGVSVSV